MNEEQLLAIANDTRIVVKDLSERISKLEAQNESLKELIDSMCRLDNLHDDVIQAWEIRDMLYTWANR